MLRKQDCVALLLAGIVGMSGPLSSGALADSSPAPLKMRLSNSLDAEKSHYGDPFEGVLTESYPLDATQTLSEGTVLRGIVQTARRSRPYALPGYVTLDIQEVRLPSGEIYRFQSGHWVQTKKIMHPNAKTLRNVANGALPFTALTLGISIPLRCATDMSGYAIFPITMGARMVFGVLWEMTGRDKLSPVKNAPPQTRVGYGLLRGTGAPVAYYFLKPSPEPNLQAGSIIPLQVRKSDLANFRELASHSSATQTEPAQQISP